MAVTAAVLTEGESTTDAASYATASITPTAGRVLLAFISVGQLGGAPAITSVTGNGLTWTPVTSVASSTPNRRTSCYWALALSPSAGAVTINLDATAGNCAWRIVELTGASADFTTVKFASATGSGATKTVTLGTAPRADSAVFGIFNANTASDVPVAGTDFTEIGDDELTNPTTPSSRLFTEYDNTSPGTGVTATGGSGAEWEVIGVEIASGQVVTASSIASAVSVPSPQLNQRVTASSIASAASVPSPTIQYDQFVKLFSEPANLLAYNQATIEDGNTTGFTVNNGTIAATSAQKFAGTYSLQVTAAGTADVEAVTTSFATTPGEVWSARASYRSAVTGRSVLTQLRWGGAGNALISTTTGGATDNTSGWVEATVNGGVAPAGAEFVSVKTTILAPVAGEVHYVDQLSLHRGALQAWDNPVVTHYSIKSAESFGNLLPLEKAGSEGAVLGYYANQNSPSLAFASPHNLLNFNQASIETSAAGWSIFSGATSIQQSNAQAHHGNFSLQINTDVGFEVGQTSGQFVQNVSPGALYTASFWSRAGVAARDLRTDIWFLTPAGAFISNETGHPVANSTSAWTQHIFTGRAPAGSGQARMILRGATAGAGDVHYVDSAGFWATPNLLGAASDEAASWIPEANTVGPDPTTAQFLDGPTANQISSVAAGTIGIRSPDASLGATPVTPGRTYYCQAYVRSATVGRTCRIRMNWRTAAYGYISTVGQTHTSVSVTGSWTRLQWIGTAPATAGVAQPIIEVTGTAGAGEVHYLDRITMVDATWTVPLTSGGFRGEQALAITAKATGHADLGMSSPWVPVEAGQTYTILGAFRAESVSRSCNVQAHLYSAGGAYVGSLGGGGTGALADSTGGWTQVSSVITIPWTNVAWLGVNPVVQNTVPGETHYLDAIGVFKGVRAAPEWEVPAPTIRTRITAQSILTEEVFGGNSVVNPSFERDANLLSTNQSSIETDSSGWVVEFNCSKDRTTAQAVEGSASLIVTATAAGAFGVMTTKPSGGLPIPVIPGRTYSAVVWGRAATQARSMRVQFRWFRSLSDADFSQSATSSVTTNTTGWVSLTHNAVAPADALYASVYVTWDNGTAGEIHYIDRIGMFDGITTTWVTPSFPPGWQLNASGGASQASAQYAHSGSVSVRLAKSGALSGYQNLLRNTSPWARIMPGERIFVSAWYRPSVPQPNWDVTFRLRVRNAAGAFLPGNIYVNAWGEWVTSDDPGPGRIYLGRSNPGLWQRMMRVTDPVPHFDAHSLDIELFNDASPSIAEFGHVGEFQVERVTPLVANGDFETDLTGWTMTGGILGMQDASQFKVGSKSMRLTPMATGDNYAQYAVNGVGFPGRTYIMTFWARAASACQSAGTSSSTTGAIGLQENTGAFRFIANNGGTPVNFTTSWQKFTMVGTAPADAAANFRVVLRGGTSGGVAVNVYYDDVQFFLVPEYTHTVPGTGATNPPSVQMNIAASSIGTGERFGGNLIPPVYAGFEADSNADGLADGWMIYAGTGADEWTRDEAYWGTRSQRFYGDGVTLSPRIRLSYVGGAPVTNTLPVTLAMMGQPVTLSAWFYSEGGATPALGLKGFDATGNEILSTALSTGSTASGWQRVVAGPYVLTDTNLVGISPTPGMTNTPSAAQSVFIDAVQVEVNTAATTFPALEVQGGGVAQLIQASSIAVPHHTFGGNLTSAAQSKSSVPALGFSESNQSRSVVGSRLRARSGIGMLQLQVPRTQNLLTGNQANCGEDGTASGWTALNFISAGPTSTTAQAASGTRSIQFTASAAQASIFCTPTGTSGHPCFPDTQYTGSFKVRSAAASGRTVRAIFFWYNSVGGLLSQSNGSTVTATTTGWTQATVTANSDPSAAFCTLIVEVTNSASGEVFYVDEAAVFLGTTTTWAAGGNARECHAINSSGYSNMQCSPSTQYTAGAWGWQLGSAQGYQSQTRLFRLNILWYDANGNFITSSQTPQVTLSTSAWTESLGTVTSPANAAWTIIEPMVQSTVNMLPGELFYIDDLTFETVARPVGFGNALEFRDGSSTGPWSIPDTAENSISGDMEIILYARMPVWSGASVGGSEPTRERALVSKYVIAGDQREWIVYFGNGSTSLNFGHTSAAAGGVGITQNLGWNTGLAAGSWQWIRATHDVDNGNDQNVIRFYTGTSQYGPWTQVAINTGAGTFARYNSTAAIQLGRHSTGGVFAGAIAYFELRNGIGDEGRTVALFDARLRQPNTRRSIVEWPAGPHLGSFAIDFDQNAVGWSGNFATLKRVPVNGAGDLSALRATATSASADWGFFTSSTSFHAPVVPGRTYTGYGYLTQVRGSYNVSARLNWRRADGSVISITTGTATALTTSPQLYTATGVAPADAAYAMLNFYANPAATVGDSFDLGRAGIFEGAGMWTPSDTAATAGWGWEPALRPRWFTFEPDGQFLHLNRDGSCYLSTPNVAEVQITGDIDLRACVSADVWSTGGFLGIASKDGPNGQAGWWWRLDTGGNSQFGWSKDGTNAYAGASGGTASATIPAAWKKDGGRDFIELRVTFDVDNGLGGYTLKLWAAPEGQPLQLIGWTINTTAGPQSIFNSTQALEIGRMHGASHYMAGAIKWLEARRGINGKVVAAFDAEIETITGSQLPATASTLNGATWTINGTGWRWSPPDQLGVEPYWVPYIGAPNVRRSTVAPPPGCDGFDVGTVIRESVTNYAEFFPVTGSAGVVTDLEPYSALTSWRVPVPLSSSRLFTTAKVNWGNAAGSYLDQLSGPSANSNGNSTGHWLHGGHTDPDTPVGASRASLASIIYGDPVAGEVWFSARYGIWHGEVPEVWEPGTGTTLSDEGGPALNLRITAASIASAASVPGPSAIQIIRPESIRRWNAIQLRDGGYMTAPGDNFVSTVMCSFEAPNDRQGVTGLPSPNQCTLTYTADGYPNILSSNDANFETSTGIWVGASATLDSAGLNLLPYNTATIDTSAADWGSTNGTATLSNAQAAHGPNSLRIERTLTGAGHVYAEIVSGVRPAVTVGNTYSATAQLRAATTGRNCRITLRWFTAGGAQLGDVAGTPVADNTTGWVTVTSTGTAPATAATVAVFITVENANQNEVHYADKVAINAGTSTEWTLPVPALDGSRALAATPTAAAPAGGMQVTTPTGTNGFPVVPGRTYRASAWVRAAVAPLTGAGIRARIFFYNAVGSIIQAFDSSSTNDSTSVWTSLHGATEVAPPDAAYAAVDIRWGGGLGLVEGQGHYVDRVSFEDITAAVAVTDGVQCCKITSTTGSAFWGPFENVRAAATTTAIITPGQQYTLSGMATRGQGQYSLTARIEWRDSSGGTISTTSGTAVALGATPTLVSCTGTAPANTTYCTATFYVTSAAAPGDYYFLDGVCLRPGTATDYVDSYNTGQDLDIRIGFRLDSYVVTGPGQTLIGKYEHQNNKRSWIIQINPDSSILLKFSLTGGSGPVNVGSTATLASIGALGGRPMAIRIHRSTSTGNVTFWYSTALYGGSWVQLGAVVPSTAGLLFRSDADLVVGVQDVDNVVPDPMDGEIYWIELLESFNGNPVFRFDAQTIDATAAQLPAAVAVA